ncbi:MAG: patatin-like phospholipase family protein [Deltaproteobacteria bacterium]|nr:patatin-like phospholipase family protein [Deltaproteobacteria bacterium]
MTNIFHKKKQVPPQKIGLALGSGSARGWAHIGVIQALTAAGIRVDYVAGTSIGALVGAVYASGRRLCSPTRLEKDHLFIRRRPPQIRIDRW